MSYQVLARKYRPKNFETLVGQEHVVRALTHALHSGRLHHAYLFTGTRGVGKTTLSRILAKSLNCVGPDGNGGITATPCGVCEACTAIDSGRFVDYIEMDAASNRGVDEMAQLLEQAVYAPSNARFKVYMIDEVHMLTNHAFNSMLKTLEEPPEHVKFILATTDPQKIPVTVLSRCLQFNLKQMPPGHIIGHLENILGQEAITFEQPALRLLAAGAHGSMRDALSLTDQAIAYAAGAVTLDAVQGMLGALDQSYLIRLLDALAAHDGADLLAVADEMATRSLSYNGALQDLGTLLHRIALAQTVPAALPEDLPEYADIVRLAAAFDAEEVQLYYQIAVHGRNELGLAPDEYAGFSMTLLRMLAFRPGVGGAEGQPAAAPAVSRQAAMASARAAAGASPARAAANVQASHASVVPPSVISGAAAIARNNATPSAPAAGTPMASPAALATAPSPAAAALSATAPSAVAAPSAAPPSPLAAAVAAASAASPSAAPAIPAPAMPAAAPAAVAAAPSAPPAPSSGAPISTARAAINAALEAARAASRPGGARPASSSPAPAAPVSAAHTPAAAQAAAAPQAPAAAAASAPSAQMAAPARPAPWEDMPPAADGGAAVLEAPVRVAQPQAAPQQLAPAPQAKQQAAEDDDLPPWVTEFSDDSAIAAPSSHPYAPAPSAAPSAHAGQPDDPHAIAMPARAAPAPAKAPYAYVVTPVPELNWDGNWPAVAAALPLRGTAQQLAMQAEMVRCGIEGNAAVFTLRVPIETWRTPGNIEKLTSALSERFGRPVRVDSELGAVWYTASAEAHAYREACQRAAEQTIANDPFVNSMIRELDAWVVPSSIVPPQFGAAAAA
ncbi:DNA polymerase III subunit gamma/tau [Duganella sp. sic0402]|uniref:DNA polymerase III subunit gamma/tau n=1 Tax=Duganella sp. sic0402 TaxID=2854786 RepID=UPI001C46A531|nr:DNA polymerase III subunit gamma/tau [Duganella sp. sic0402]MBV7538964.1 DNA polymerase III subunit gamma/tau [Duganella sp. sic0402]